ncbi:MAG: EamA family transporter RarD [Rhodospirillales bacterium]|nr:EamA family transporter RarD [Rhodospirillales bacterium]
MACATGAYLLWGLFPLYFKAVASIPAGEMLAQRILWSLLLFWLIITVRGAWDPVRRALRSWRLLAALTLSAGLIAVNWGVFIWAVAAGHVLECSLGYFITPLLSVMLGVVVLGERLEKLQWMAVVMAAGGVLWQVIAVGTVPWVALTLAASFAGYGLVRKMISIDAVSGLFVESMLLAPPALAWLLWLEFHGGAFASAGWRLDLLIALSGPITALPLILFVAGARRIRLATVGLLQYITPTCHLLLALFVFAESFAWSSIVVFACIWAALAVYTFDMLRRDQR